MRFHSIQKHALFRTILLTAVLLLLGSGPAVARNACQSAFGDAYPGSTTNDDAGCATCHEGTGEPWNGYGWDLRVRLGEILQDDPSGACSNTNRNNGTLAAALADIENLDSDTDVSGTFSNIQEIGFDTQPGWTTGANNTLYSADGSTTTGESAPTGIGTLDPVGEPDSDGDGVPDSSDNCTDVGNSDQTDTDGDLYGNACDADFTNDGVVNGLDTGTFVAQFGTTGPDADFNNDAVVNGLDVGPFTSMFGQAPGPSGLVP